MKRRIGMIDVDVVDGRAAAAHILGKARRGEPGMVAFCNAHSVNLASRDADFAALMNQAMVLNDGIGLDLASRTLYRAPFPENLNGTDFTPALLAAAGEGLRLFLLGSPPGVAERAAAALKQRFPQHHVVGIQHGFFAPDAEAELAERIAAAAPQLILVGMGQPRQEKWAARHHRRFPAMTLCIGAYLDFAAGAVPRAPDWIRRARLEWAFRLAGEPRRLAGRYLIGNAEFMLRLARDRLRQRRRK